MMTLINVARDVVSELFARKVLLALLIIISLGLLVFTFALDLEVVEGALAAGKLFGQKLQGDIVAVDVVLRPVFGAMTSAVFFLGILFGIVATSDIAPKLLSSGRVELLLSLPIPRLSLVLGTYIGVILVAAFSMVFTIIGASLILFVKAGFFTWAPFIGALSAIVGFASVYALMMFVACVFRSAALSAAAGIFLFCFSLLADDRNEIPSWFRAEWIRSLVEVIITPLPRLLSISQLGPSSFTNDALLQGALPLWGSALFFAATFVGLAAFVVSRKDY